MSVVVALLRGINVGGNNLLPMKSLQQTLTALGCSQVKTYIQTGNVVLVHEQEDLQRLGESITQAIDQAYGFKPQILFLDAQQFADAIDHNPFSTEVGKALHFYFLAAPATQADRQKIEQLLAPSEQYLLTDEVFYLYAPDGVGRSKLAAKIEAYLDVPVTARNWNTVAKIKQMLADTEPTEPTMP